MASPPTILTKSCHPRDTPLSESLWARARDLHQAIARRALDLFERRGHEDGRDLDDWLQAESELAQPDGSFDAVQASRAMATMDPDGRLR
jgi:hypothetical protein